MRDGEALGGLFEPRGEAEGEAGNHFIGALALLAKQIERAAKTGTGRKFVNAATENQDAIAYLLGESPAQVSNVLVEFAACLDNQFGGGGRRGSAHVGDEIGDGEVGLVADSGDYGNLRIENGAGDDFFVEGPQVFEGATAAGENQHVHELFCIEELHRFDDFLSGAFALHAHGKHGEMDVGKTAREDA